MKNLDKYINALYLASSPLREEMLESLIESVLFSWGDPVSLDQICELIHEYFSINPVKIEVDERLKHLLENETVQLRTSKEYVLTQNAKKELISRKSENESLDNFRYLNFEKMLNQIPGGNVEESIKIKIWENLNKYIIECFRINAKEAINLFLPYSDINEKNSDFRIYQKYLNDIGSEAEMKLFEKLINLFPHNLSRSDLDHFDNLANRAESICSLGLPKEEYEKISQGIKLLDWTIVADTNFLYSVLDLRPHPENAAVGHIKFQLYHHLKF